MNSDSYQMYILTALKKPGLTVINQQLKMNYHAKIAIYHQ